MAKGVNLHHCGDYISRNERVTHAGRCLHHPVADVAHCENARFSACFENPVVDLGNQGFEMEGAGVAHTPGAFDEHLWLGKILFGPVHPEPKSVALMVVRSEFLAPKLPLRAGHVLSPSPSSSYLAS